MVLPLILAIASVLALLTLIGACQRYRTPGALPLALFAASITWWDLWSVLELATDDFELMVLASKVEYLGIALLPVAWLQLGARLRDGDRRLPGWVWCLVVPVAVIVPLLAFTNDVHHLIWASIARLPAGPGPKAVYTHGPAWFAIVAWTYLLLGWGTLLLIRAGLSWPRRDRCKAWLLIIAVLVPWLANLVYAADLVPLPGLEPTPVALTVTGALLLLGLGRRFRLLDLTPIAADVLLANLRDAVLVIDDAGRLVHANPAAHTLGLLRPAVTLGSPAAEVCTVWPSITPRLGEQDWRTEVDVPGPSAAPRTLELRGLNLEANHGQVGHLLVATDITQRKQAEAALARQARSDGLTGLPNRTLLYERLAAAIGRGEPAHPSFALLLLDLDRFKAVNDTFGHLAGDRLLCEVATRLSGLVRPGDTVARLGGDEFAVLLAAADATAGAAVAGTLFGALNEPIELEGQRVAVGASVGVVACPEHGTDVQTLIRRADLAMYAAKRAASGPVVYDPVEHERGTERRLLPDDALLAA